MTTLRTIATLGCLLAPNGQLTVHYVASAWTAAWRESSLPYTARGKYRAQCVAHDTDPEVALRKLAARMVECSRYEADHLASGDEQDRELALELREALASVDGTNCRACGDVGCALCKGAA